MSESRFPSHLGRGWIFSLMAVLACVALPVWGAPFGADPEQAEPLLAQLGERFEILTLTDSYVLRPIAADVAYETVEIKAGTVAVDGETVSRPRLRELLGDDVADTVLGLSDLGSAEWQATEELRERIERMTQEQRLRAEEIEELIRSRVQEIETLEDEHLEAIEEALDDERRKERRRHARADRRRVRTDTRVSFGSSLTIEDNETSQDVVVLGGSLDVDGEVEGDAVIVGGSAEVQGEVSGSVTAIGGSIVLGPEGRIRGDATSIGGAVHRDPGAQVYGEITEVALGRGVELDDLWDGIWIPGWHWLDFGIGELVSRVGTTVVLGILLALILLIFQRLVTGVADRAEEEPWKAGLVGLGTQLLFLFALPVVTVILLVTIVGIPLALILGPVAFLLLVVAFLLGFTGIAIAGGRWLKRRFDWPEASPYVLMALGLVLIQGWSIAGEGLGFLGDVLGCIGGPIKLGGWALLLLGFVIKYVAWTVGLGAVLLYRSAPRTASAGTLPPPPPVPPSPQSLDELRRAAAWDETTVDAETQDEPPPPDPDEEYLRAAEGDAPGEEPQGDEPPGDEAPAEAEDDSDASSAAPDDAADDDSFADGDADGSADADAEGSAARKEPGADA